MTDDTKTTCDKGLKKTGHGESKRFLNEVVLPYDGDECLLWPFWKNHKGYGVAYVNSKPVFAHKIVCEYINGPKPPDKNQVAHSCGNGRIGCVTPAHLRWATSKENMEDQYIQGKRPLGSRHPLSKLTADDVIAIREIGDSQTRGVVAEMFGVTKANIRQILQRKTWAHV